MISVEHVTKKFKNKTALDDICCSIGEGTVYGLIGYNGAGKTTLLKTISGIYRAESGQVLIDGQNVYENEMIKLQMFIMTEELYFLPQATLLRMRDFYRGYYPTWSDEIFYRLTEVFKLNLNHKIGSFSKGMQRQAGIITAFAVLPKYLFLDEAFDGLDLSMRYMMKKMLDDYISVRKATAIITSHNLSELGGFADRIGMIRDCRLSFDGPVEALPGGSLEKFFLNEREQKDYDFKTIFQQ